VDAADKGDVTRTGLVWAYKRTGVSLSTVSIAGGVLYVATNKYLVHPAEA